MTKELIVGVDPDVYKSGVACYIKRTNKLECSALTFFQLFDYLQFDKNNINKVVIEAGWLNSKSNFRGGKNANINARIGKNVGSNHEVGRKIVEMCEYLNIDYKIVKPLKKTWKGEGGKITHDEFVKITGIIGRTNQEMRDAALLVI